MTSQTTTKVRLVKCPRCRLLLPELPGFALYQCGGCGAVLQAKNKKDNKSNSDSHVQDTDATQRKEQDLVSEHNKETRMAHMGNVHNIGNGTEENEIGDHEKEKPKSKNYSNALPSPTGLACHDRQQPSLESVTLKDEVEQSSMEQNGERHHNVYGAQNREPSGGLEVSGEAPLSTELTSQAKDDLSPPAGVLTEADGDKYSLDQENGNNRKQFGDDTEERLGTPIEESSLREPTFHENKERDHHISEDCNGEQTGGIDESDEVSSSNGLDLKETESLPAVGAHGLVVENKYSFKQKNGTNQDEFGSFGKDLREYSNFRNENSSGVEITCQESDLLSVSEASKKVNENKYNLESEDARIQNESGDSHAQGTLSTEVSEVFSPARLPCHEIEGSSPLAAEGENFKSHFTLNSSSVQSSVTERRKDKLLVAHRPSGKSVLSDNYTPSFEEQQQQPQRSSVLHGGSTADNYTSLFEEQQQQPQRSVLRGGSTADTLENTLVSPNTNAKPAKVSKPPKPGNYNAYGKIINELDQNGRLEHRRKNHPTERRMRLEKNMHPSMSPFNSTSSQAGNENGNHPIYGNKGFTYSSSFRLSDEPKDHERQKLLRMVHELQNQLNRLHSLKDMRTNETFSPTAAQKQTSFYNGDRAGEIDMNQDSRYFRYSGRCYKGKILPHQCKISRMPFPWEVSSCNHQEEHSCLCCCHYNRHYSAQLPSHVVGYNKRQSTALPGRKSYSSQLYGPSSHQQFSSSEVSPWNCGTNSGDRWNKYPEVKKSYLRGSDHLARQYFRPTAGGAPFIACYSCSQILQLPADFLPLRRRHRLQCSACLTVLKFSIQNRTHIVPYTPKATVAPPPSEVDEISNAVNERKLGSSSHTNDCTNAACVQSSDDHGESLQRHCSTEGETSPLKPPLGILGKIFDERIMLSAYSSEATEDRQMNPVSRVHVNKHENDLVSFQSDRPSSKISRVKRITSEIEEMPLKTGSPLHWLMGYSTPSQVI